MGRYANLPILVCEDRQRQRMREAERDRLIYKLPVDGVIPSWRTTLRAMWAMLRERGVTASVRRSQGPRAVLARSTTDAKPGDGSKLRIMRRALAQDQPL
jgi:hypothetical protein